MSNVQCSNLTHLRHGPGIKCVKIELMNNLIVPGLTVLGFNCAKIQVYQTWILAQLNPSIQSISTN